MSSKFVDRFDSIDKQLIGLYLFLVLVLFLQIIFALVESSQLRKIKKVVDRVDQAQLAYLENLSQD